MGFSIGDVIPDPLEDLVDEGRAAVEAAGDAVEDLVHSAANAVAAATDLAEDLVRDAIDTVETTLDRVADLAEDVGDALAGAIASAGKWIAGVAIAAADWIADAASDTWHWIRSTAENAWDALQDIGDWVERVAEKAWKIVNDVVEWIEKVVKTAIWVIMNLDDILYALLAGFVCLLFGRDEQSYPILRFLCSYGKAEDTAVKTCRSSAASKYVAFSDHHMFLQGSVLDQFRKLGNDQLYLKVLAEYGRRNFVLVENGDLEDLWMREASLGDLLLDRTLETIAGPFGEALEEVFEGSALKKQLGGIIANNIHVYSFIRELFFNNGRYVRLIGNHDDELRDRDLLRGVRTVYPGLVIYDYLLICPESAAGWDDPKVVVTHGHQFDAWNAHACAAVAGEAITEVVSGLSTIWGESSWAASTTSRSKWRSKMNGSGFDNELADLTVTTFFGSSQSVDELELEDLMKESFPTGRAPEQPHIVIGHTHSPRFRAWDDHDKPFTKYTNSGTAGRFEQLLWCVEVVNGAPTLHAWFENSSGQLVDCHMVGNHAKLVRA